MSKIAHVWQANDNAVEIELDDGRQVRVILDSPYNPKGIKVLRWGDEFKGQCEFREYQFPED